MNTATVTTIQVNLTKFFQAVALIATWEDLQEVKPYIGRYRRNGNRLYDRLKRGETVEVRAMLNGREFAIRPEGWEGFILGYTCLVNGQEEPGYKGKLLAKDQLWDWADQLIERA